MTRVIKLPCTHRGAALVEFAMLMGIVLPIWFGITMLGKITDLNQTTEQASRYATWEATVYTQAQLADQQADAVEKRFFGTPDVLLFSNTQGNSTSTEHPLWGATSVPDTGIRQLGDVARHTELSASVNYEFDLGQANIAVAAGHAAATLGSLLDDFSGNSWGLVADGMLQSTVSLPVHTSGFLHAGQQPCGVASSGSPVSEQNATFDHTCVRSSGVILADGWSASNDSQAASRVRSLVPVSLLEPFGQALGSIGGTIFPELDSLDHAFGHVDMSVLPAYSTE